MLVQQCNLGHFVSLLSVLVSLGLTPSVVLANTDSTELIRFELVNSDASINLIMR